MLMRLVLRWYKIFDRLLWHIPSSCLNFMRHRKIYIKHKLKNVKKHFYQYMEYKMGHFIVECDPGPFGDKEIIMRTSVLRKEHIPGRMNPDRYFIEGYLIMLSWLQHLERYSFNIRTAQAIMELGCGSARLIRHLCCIDGIRLVGTDVKKEFIEWCRLNVPGVEFYVNDLRPPLSFAEDGSFDLVFAQSVFTHIPLEIQDLWIRELCRVLSPGGFLMVNVLGYNHQKQMLDAEDQVQLKKQGYFILDAANPRASFSTQLIESWDVFQTRTAVLRAFGSVFHVHDYIPARPLDLLVLQKPK